MKMIAGGGPKGLCATTGYWALVINGPGYTTVATCFPTLTACLAEKSRLIPPNAPPNAATCTQDI